MTDDQYREIRRRVVGAVMVQSEVTDRAMRADFQIAIEQAAIRAARTAFAPATTERAEARAMAFAGRGVVFDHGAVRKTVLLSSRRDLTQRFRAV